MVQLKFLFDCIFNGERSTILQIGTEQGRSQHLRQPHYCYKALSINRLSGIQDSKLNKSANVTVEPKANVHY